MDEHLIESSEKHIAQQLEWQVNEIRNGVKKEILPPRGKCNNCCEPFKPVDGKVNPKKFCDDLCAEDWNEWYQQQVRKHGPAFTPRSAC